MPILVFFDSAGRTFASTGGTPKGLLAGKKATRVRTLAQGREGVAI
jgi:hypothetical protein